MKFKAEVTLLVFAIALFAVATFFYSYQVVSGGSFTMSQSLTYPYRTVALAFVGAGSVSMVTASISYSKKTKELIL
jgi:hypothetical protein